MLINFNFFFLSRILHQYWFYIAILSISPVVSREQEEKIVFRLLDSSNIPIKGASVILKGKDKIKSFSSSNENGEFTIPKGTSVSNVVLIVKHISFLDIIIGSDDLRQIVKEGLSYNLYMEKKSSRLDEIIVTATRSTEPDSISLNLNNLNLSDNSTLREILKKNINFIIDEDGTILYKGKSIEKITVNNKQAFINQNSIALESIEKRMIEDLKIVNNHRKKFNLDFDELSETILDIKVRKQYSNIIKPSIGLGGGLKNKFEGNAEVFYFGDKVNFFLKSSNNNMGKNSLNLSEINKFLLSQGMKSSFQYNYLNELLFPDKNRLSDFTSTNTLAIRKEDDVFRLNSSIYYISADRERSAFQKVSTYNESILYSSDRLITSSSNTLLSNFIVDFKLKSNQILSNQIGLSYMNGNDKSVEDFFVQAGDLSPIISQNKLKVAEFMNRLSYDIKISSKAILSSRSLWSSEGSKISGDIKEGGINSILYAVNYPYNRSNIGQTLQIKFKVSDQFTPTLDFDYRYLDESIVGGFNKEVQTIKSYTTYRAATVKVVGQKVFNKIRYEGKLGVEDTERGLIANKKGYLNFPYEVKIRFENRLDLIDFMASKRFSPLDLSAGMNQFQSFNKVVFGNLDILSQQQVDEKWELRYAHNNLFKMYTYGVHISYVEKNNLYREGVVSLLGNGIQLYKLYLIPKITEQLYSLYGSKTLFSSAYPLNTYVHFKIINNNMKVYAFDTPMDLYSHQQSILFNLETLTDSPFNIECTSNFKTTRIELPTMVNRYNNWSNRIILKYRKAVHDGKVEFLYHNDRMFGQQYVRKNFNASYTRNIRRTLIGIEAQNLDDLFNLFNNRAYNSSLSFENGLNFVQVRNMAINYIQIFFKHNF